MRCCLASISILGEQCPAQGSKWPLAGGCERIAAAVLLVAALPPLAFCALVVRLLSGRSPFIAHRRVGWRGAELWMLKLRTMWDEGTPPRPAPWIERIADDSGPSLKTPADARVPHAFARFCRRHSLDELPQLFHVVRGEMSLVGPRPLTAREIRAHYGADAAEILSLKPGIAGLWQTSGRNRLTYEQRRRMDLEFVRSRSIGMYTRILLRTIPEVWGGGNTC
jgi:lipopolysaccharide/colanic/teichoic acid biosynthesis glycosyltransferase